MVVEPIALSERELWLVKQTLEATGKTDKYINDFPKIWASSFAEHAPPPEASTKFHQFFDSVELGAENTRLKAENDLMAERLEYLFEHGKGGLINNYFKDGKYIRGVSE